MNKNIMASAWNFVQATKPQNHEENYNMSQEAAIASVIISALVIGACASLGGCYMVESTEQAAIKAGLVQKQSGNTIIWVKPEGDTQGK